LVREGLVRRARGRPRGDGGVIAGLRVPTHANAVWTVDFKGNFRLGNRDECYPLTLRDLASRYSLRCDGLAQPDEPTVRRKVDTAFQDYGLPDAIRSDNGPPFAAGGLGGLTQLSVWWLRLGIAIEHIAPGRPEQNGSHEQFHRVLKSATTRPPAQTLRQQQQRFNQFRREYNEERPHAALGNDVPADHYTPSARPWPRRPPALDYPGHWETHRVTTNGCVRIRRVVVFVSRALNGQDISFEEIDDQLWTVHFGRFALARWHEPDAHLRPIRIA
jgi:transposase InsO family protein